MTAREAAHQAAKLLAQAESPPEWFYERARELKDYEIAESRQAGHPLGVARGVVAVLETRSCGCGCGRTFTAAAGSEQRFRAQCANRRNVRKRA